MERRHNMGKVNARGAGRKPRFTDQQIEEIRKKENREIQYLLWQKNTEFRVKPCLFI